MMDTHAGEAPTDRRDSPPTKTKAGYLLEALKRLTADPTFVWEPDTSTDAEHEMVWNTPYATTYTTYYERGAWHAVRLVGDETGGVADEKYVGSFRSQAEAMTACLLHEAWRLAALQRQPTHRSEHDLPS